MPLTEINFDGLIGPSHNYAGLSPGNLAATSNKGAVAHPRAAALQGIEKMIDYLSPHTPVFHYILFFQVFLITN